MLDIVYTLENHITVENTALFLKYAVPGFVILYFLSQFKTGRNPSLIKNIFTYLLISVLYHMLLLSIGDDLYDFMSESHFYWITIILAIPACIGIAVGFILQKE